MHRTDKSRFLLYIEPLWKKKRKNPINDALTQMMKYELKRCKRGLANYSDLESEGRFTQSNKGYRGTHWTECGEYSTNQDYLLPNGMITNSLAPFYLEYYRNCIPRSEMKKVVKLFIYSMWRINKVFLIEWLLIFRYFILFKCIPYRKSTEWKNELEFMDDEDDEMM